MKKLSLISALVLSLTMIFPAYGLARKEGLKVPKTAKNAADAKRRTGSQAGPLRIKTEKQSRWENYQKKREEVKAYRAEREALRIAEKERRDAREAARLAEWQRRQERDAARQLAFETRKAEEEEKNRAADTV